MAEDQSQETNAVKNSDLSPESPANTDIKKSSSLTHITYKGKKIVLLGTAHVSKESVIEVEEYIKTQKPDTVCVELCENRYQAIIDKDRWKKMDIYQVVKSGKGLLLLANLLVSSFQQKIGKKLGVKPGAEMIAAIELAEKEQAKLKLIDRDVQATLKRTWAHLGFFRKMSLFSSITASLFVSEDVDAEQIEKMKESDTMAELMKSFGEEAPEIMETIIDERDQYMASHLMEMDGDHIVAIIGAGHGPGIKSYIEKGDAIDRSELEIIPAKSKLFKVIKWVIPAIILLAFGWGYHKHGQDLALDLIIGWILANGVLSALGAMIALGKVRTIITAFFAAPITSLNPTIGASMVCGLVEASIRKPSVEECERLQDDISDGIKGIYRNSITRILLVGTFSGLGSALGTYLGAYYIFDKVSSFMATQ